MSVKFKKDFKDMLAKIKEGENFAFTRFSDGELHILQNKKIAISDLSKPLVVLIGQEGDFSEKERVQILKFEGVQSIKLNNNILRSETAVISSLSIINYLIN